MTGLQLAVLQAVAAADGSIMRAEELSQLPAAQFHHVLKELEGPPHRVLRHGTAIGLTCVDLTIRGAADLKAETE